VAKRTKIWKRQPEERDFSAAHSYLTLLCKPARAKLVVERLRRFALVEHQAKDLLRASALPLLPRDEPHVEDDLKRIRKGKTLSPVLLVQGDIARGLPLVIADGYHRICAVYYHDESAPIACRIAPV